MVYIESGILVGFFLQNLSSHALFEFVLDFPFDFQCGARVSPLQAKYPSFHKLVLYAQTDLIVVDFGYYYLAIEPAVTHIIHDDYLHLQPFLR